MLGELSDVDVSDVNIYPGETMTVWLNRNGRHREREAVQVELRVREDGMPEIFCDRLRGKSFKGWKPMEEAQTQEDDPFGPVTDEELDACKELEKRCQVQAKEEEK